MARGQTKNADLRRLPSVDEMLRTETAREIAQHAGEGHTGELVRRVIGEMRAMLMGTDGPAGDLVEQCETDLRRAWRFDTLSGTHRVINATGVVLHTNLGRAPLSANAIKAMAEEASGYCTLEYDLNIGKRGRRGAKVESLVAELTGAESVLIVNNCAAAAFFVLMVFAAGSEVVISRGELVEIGGDFRVPDVLSRSGAKLREVGTTNRTKIADYEKAINDNTRLLLRVHPSNYRIVGFTAMPPLRELADLAHSRNLLIYEDLGSGALLDLAPVGLVDEPLVKDSIAAGVDIVSFSGDKLLGGPQAGIIAGKAEYLDRLRSHPLYRALRVDKIAYAGLEATLESYRRGAPFQEIPVLKMLTLSYNDLRSRSQRFLSELKDPESKYDVVDGTSAIGGGAAPTVELRSAVLKLSHAKLSAAKLEQKLRRSDPPVIVRIVDEYVIIDLRTVSEEDEPRLLEILNGID